MMRIRMPNGFTNAAQLSAIGELSRECGTGFVDITTRQQIQLRGFAIGDVPHIWERLNAVDLVSLQTGMDNIRNVVGCPVAGLTRRRAVRRLAGRARVQRRVPAEQGVHEPAAEVQRRDHRLHGELHARAKRRTCADAGDQDHRRARRSRASTSRSAAKSGRAASGSRRRSTCSCRPEEAASLCSHITLIFRDYGSRRARNRARLAFLIDAWGVERFRQELRAPRRAAGCCRAGRDARTARARRSPRHLARRSSRA